MINRPDIKNMKLGDTVYVPVTFDHNFEFHEGKIVYIHPELRFYTVEFQCGESRIRESYCAYGPLK